MSDVIEDVQLRYLQMLVDAGCKIRYKTFWNGVNGTYVWLTDPHGTWFLERIPDELPD